MIRVEKLRGTCVNNERIISNVVRQSSYVDLKIKISYLCPVKLFLAFLIEDVHLCKRQSYYG